MSRNTLWQIAFGDYDFALDRRALTYSLTDTKTGTIWATGLLVGWLELENRETGERTRHTFGDMKLVSLSEKSGQQGKRILLGLDCQGVPVDLYFICSQKEIQLTVEASRDTRTHRVQDVCLLPGLVSVPDDGVSYLVVPHREGVILRAADVTAEKKALAVWDAENGVIMPFIGAVKNRTFNEPISALALITDSAYGTFHLNRHEDESATLDTVYERDPERRRLDIRLVVLPEQNHVGVARAYRNKIIVDRNHVTLRQKMRERPKIDAMVGGAWLFAPMLNSEVEDYDPSIRNDLFTFTQLEAAIETTQSLGVASGLVLMRNWNGVDANEFPTVTLKLDPIAGDEKTLKDVCQKLQSQHFLTAVEHDYSAVLYREPDDEELQTLVARDQNGLVLYKEFTDSGRWCPEVTLNTIKATEGARANLSELADRFGFSAFVSSIAFSVPHEDYSEPSPMSRWDEMEAQLSLVAAARESLPIVGSEGSSDWSSIACDFWLKRREREASRLNSCDPISVPLSCTVYHDSVITLLGPDDQGLGDHDTETLLKSILYIAPPMYDLTSVILHPDLVQRTYAVLGPLHGLSFAAFLSEHRFLTPDFKVEEARYTNGAYILINQSETESYETEQVTLPPLGFYVLHPQMVAYDALRVGEESFSTRAYRVTRSQDGKPIAESADVLRQEFPV